MIIYSSDKTGFLRDKPILPDVLEASIMDKLGEETSPNEKLSWVNSLAYMHDLLDCPAIPDDAGIALEYNIPVTNNRIDFIITGLDGDGVAQAVIIELKQWSHVEKTDMDGIVRARYSEGIKETEHPSYQAFTYCMLLQDYKVAVQKHDVRLKAAAYLHNCSDTGTLTDPFYAPYTKYAPVFGASEADRLRDFISRYIRKGDRQRSLYVIEDSEVRPSKCLMDSVSGMLQGKKEFRMIGDQKYVLERIMKACDDYKATGRKQVLIIEGGPGTGKSVIAVNALHEAVSKKGITAMYVSKNREPRRVFRRKLVEGGMPNVSVNALFKSSLSFENSRDGEIALLLVDEAHRLSEKGQKGRVVHQMKSIIRAAQVAVFFIDEAQIVSFEDVGTVNSIKEEALSQGAEIVPLSLKAQFRCGGSDTYLQWLDNLLDVRQTGVRVLKKSNYDFRIFDDPEKMMKEIKRRNQRNNKSRMVAGFCWDWVSRMQGHEKEMDISFPEFHFAHQWNLSTDETWCMSEGSVEQIGCIHTCQGLEFDYVGVIIGPDIICRDGKILVDPSKRSKDDKTLFGYKTMMKADPEGTKEKVRKIIKNTYRTLMSRGMKGCFVYVMDGELREYIASRLEGYTE